VNANFHRLANRSRCPLLLGPRFQQRQIHGWHREHVAIHLAQRISLAREVTETLDMMITVSELEAIIAQTVPGRLTVCARI
jgi:hypothetical protein